MNYSKIISFAMSLVLVFTLLPMSASAVELSFSDVPSGHWAAGVIDEMVAAGVMNGVGDNQFAPDKPVTYAEFATMLARHFYADEIRDANPGEPWYAPYLSVLETDDVYWGGLRRDDSRGAASIVVQPEETLTRYDMARLIYESVPKGYNPGYTRDMSGIIADWASIPINYYKSITACYLAGWLTGVDAKGTFGGTATMTRAQAAAVMSRLMASGKPPVTEVPDYVPANATKIDSKEQFSYLWDVKLIEGNVHYHPDHVRLYGYGFAGFPTSGHSVVTFNVTAGGQDVLVEYGVATTGGESRDIDTITVLAGETRTIQFDCSGTKNASIGVAKYSESGRLGSAAEAWVSNIYMW